MNGDKAIGYFCCFAFGALVAMSLPTKTDHIVLKPVQNDYRVAESLGCVEVGRVCRARKHSAATSLGAIHGR